MPLDVSCLTLLALEFAASSSEIFNLSPPFFIFPTIPLRLLDRTGMGSRNLEVEILKLRDKRGLHGLLFHVEWHVQSQVMIGGDCRGRLVAQQRKTSPT